MRNTFIESGDDEFDEMIGSIDRGIYARRWVAGQFNQVPVNSISLTEVITEDGKIQHPVKQRH